MALGLLATGTETRGASEASGPATSPGSGAEAPPGGESPADSTRSSPAGAQAAGGRLLVGYWGIYCGLCEKRGTIPERTASLLAAMRKAEYGAPAQT